jgi:hypothetical protein
MSGNPQSIPWTWLLRQFAQEIDAAYLIGDEARARYAQALLQRIAGALQASANQRGLQ